MTERKFNSVLWGTILGILAIVVITTIITKIFNNPKSNSLVKSLQDTIKTVRNKDSSTTTSIMTIQDEAFLKLELKSKDSTIIELQKQVKQYKGKLQSMTIFTSNTTIKTSSPTTVTWDTIGISKSVSNTYYPTYNNNFKLGKWAQGNITSNMDSATIDLSVFDEYIVAIGKEKKDGKWQNFTDVTSKNPYNKTPTLRTYSPVEKDHRFEISTGIGYGTNLNNGVVKLGIQVGVHLSYKLLKL